MIIGIISLLLDYLILNYLNYYIDSVIIFPMFTFIYILGLLYFKKINILFYFLLLLYISITGIIFLPCFIIFINNIVYNKNTLASYIIYTLYSLLLYDFLFYLFLSKTDIRLLINKIIVTIPINLLYALIIYYVLKRIKYKYKLV